MKDSSNGSDHTNSSEDFFDEDEQPFYKVDYRRAVKSAKQGNPYKDRYLSLGFTWTGDPSCPNPLCILCRKKFSNSSMFPSKMKNHLRARHSSVASKGAAYFRKFLKSQNRQRKKFVGRFTVTEKAREINYLIAELIAQNRESFTVGENLIMPACKIIVCKFLGQDALKGIENFTVSESVMNSCISDMSHDAEEVLCEKLKNNRFSLQVHTVTDFANKCHIIAFVRFINDSEMQENFLCYKELHDTRIKDLFHILSDYMKKKGLSWKKCVGFCAYSDPSVFASIRSVSSLVKQTNCKILTHCFLHREVLVSRTLEHDMREVLDDATNMANFVKQKPSHCRMFNKLCKSLDKECINLLLYTKTRWLSRGIILDRLYELQSELLEYFQESSRPEFAECLEDGEWLMKLVYLADIFYHVNQLNESLQGPGENILTSSDKIVAFKSKLDNWKDQIIKRNFDMFPQLLGIINEEGYQQISRLISNHLKELRNKIEHYFPCILTQGYEWVRNPYSEFAIQPGNLTLREEEELSELQTDRTLEKTFTELSLDKFWMSVEDKYPAIHMKALNILLQFSSSYTCEQAFSCLLSIKSKEKNSLVSEEDEIRVCLSKVRPRIKYLCSRKRKLHPHKNN